MALKDQFLGWLGPQQRKDERPGTVERRSESAFMPTDTAVAPAAVIQIADLDGARGREVAARLSDLLVRQAGLEVYRRNQALRLGNKIGLADRLAASAEEGRRWLKDSGADLLIWGETDSAGTWIKIRFLPAFADTDGTVGTFGLGDALHLPLLFAGELERLVVAVTLAAAGRGRSGPRTRAAELLRAGLSELEPLASSPPASLTPEQAASVLVCLGSVYAADQRLGGAQAGLDRALACYEAAATRVPKELSPLGFALAQNHRAAALQAIAERDRSPDPLRKAADAYHAVADALTRAHHPNDWALTMFRLGLVLLKVAGQTGRANDYREGGVALEQALTVFTRAAHPGRWAEIMNHYGVMLTALGEVVTGTQPLDQAITIFRAVLEVRRRDLAPLLWAQTVNNMGAAAFALGKRKNDPNRLREAYACFAGAIEVYREQNVASAIYVIEKNLQRVQQLMAGERSQAAAAPVPANSPRGKR